MTQEEHEDVKHYMGVLIEHVDSQIQQAIEAMTGMYEHLRTEFQESRKELKEDVRLTQHAIRDTRESLTRRMDVMSTEFREEMRAMDASLREEMRAMGTSLQEEMHAGDASLREEMHAGDASLREEMRAMDASLREEMRTGDASLREEMRAMEGRLGAKIDTIHERLDGHDVAIADLQAAQHP